MVKHEVNFKMKKLTKKILSFLLVVLIAFITFPFSSLANITTSSGIGKGSTIDGTDYTVTSMQSYYINSDTKEYSLYTNNNDFSSQTAANIVEIESAANSNTTSKAVVAYGDIDADGDGNISWCMKPLTKQAALWESVYPDDNIVVGVNAAWFNTSTGEPTGTTVINGIKLKDASSRAWPYFATYSDGSCTIEMAGTSISDAEIVQSEKVGENVTMTGAVAAPAILVHNGEIYNVSQGNNNAYTRTAIGIKDDGTVVIFQSDGVAEPRTVGYTQTEEAEILIALGCVEALQLDEGYSSTLITKREGEDTLTIRNTPDMGYERDVSSTILIISSENSTGVLDHMTITPSEDYYIPNSTIEFTASGFDASGNAVNSLPSDIKLQLDSDSSDKGKLEVETTNGNTITAKFTSNGTKGEVCINAIYGGEIIGTSTINIQDTAGAMAEKYSGFIIDDATGKTMYLAGGKITTGLIFYDGITYYFDDDGYGIETQYKIHGETCTFSGGTPVSCSNPDVVDFGFAGEDIAYIIYSDGSMYVEGSGDIWDFPNLTNIPWNLFKSDVTTLIIGKDITRIGNYAFRAFTSLTSVTFEEGSILDSIGYQSFDNCRFSKITLPDSLKTIGVQTFAVNSKLKEVYIPSNIESIGSGIFYKSNYAVMNIEVDPDGTSYAKQYAIANDVSYVERITDCTLSLSETIYTYTGNSIEPSVTSISYNGKVLDLIEGTDYTISYENNINTGTAMITATGINGYTDSVSTTYTILPVSQTLTINPSSTNVSVGDEINLNASGIGTLTYTSSDTSVATVNSKGIVTPVKPGSTTITVTASGDTNHSSATKTIDINVNHLGCTYTVGDLIYKVTADTELKKEAEVIGGANKQKQSISIPESVIINNTTFTIVGIANEAFENYTKLNSIYIGDNVVKIGNKAFFGCTSLKEVSGCICLVKIGQSAFYKCTSLTNVNACSSVISIGSKAFAYCTNLEKIGTDTGLTTLTKLTSIGSYAFYNCSSLTTVKIPSGITTINAKTFVRCTSLKSVTGCVNIAKIGSCAFYKCTKLANLNNCSSVTSIGSKAFAYCNNLKRIGTETGMTTLSKLTSIGSYAFYNCKSLTACKIPSGLDTINTKVFVRCTSLKSITGCTNVSSIGSYAFYKCTALTNVNNANKVTTISDKAFAYCSSLKRIGNTTSTISLPAIKTLGNYAFYNCSKISKIVSSSTSLSSIGQCAFKGCTAMKSFSESSQKLNSIGKQAFYGDNKLSTIILNSSKLTSKNVGTKAFIGIKSTCTFKVPSGKGSAYKKIFTSCGASSKIIVKKV